MAQIHELIINHGIEEARRLAATKHERMVIEAAYQVLSDDAEKMGFTYSGFALTSLPHKPQSELVWKRDGYNLTMLIESGRDRTGKPLGLPYGSYARFILLFLQSEAIRTNSREVELGRSMRVWLGSMGLSIGGTTYKLITPGAANFRLHPHLLRRSRRRPNQEQGRIRSKPRSPWRTLSATTTQPLARPCFARRRFFPGAARASRAAQRDGSPRYRASQHGNRYLYLARL